jgi:hypothetical protein
MGQSKPSSERKIGTQDAPRIDFQAVSPSGAGVSIDPLDQMESDQQSKYGTLPQRNPGSDQVGAGPNMLF